MKGLKNSPVKKLMMITGGGPASGDPCESYHYHGYIGQEKEVVDQIAAWMHHPAS
ncbi:hypothetical protein [Duganella vulcania]|uniref:hypothetical protein n=1 Tax=Duganella vulcania TaxID=2692166 RepID=UPI0015815950|nr:hypothetical protein [Duganella vulcania]